MPDPVTFPTSTFAFDEQEIDIERRTISGGTSISGEEDVIETDGGGRVFAEFASGPLLERETVLAWRAIKTRFDGGTESIIVPFCDPLHQPFGEAGSDPFDSATYGHQVPHSDDAPFADDSLYVGGEPTASARAAAALRATTIELNTSFNRDLVGGEWFSIEHPVKGWRAYRIATIVSQSPGAVVTFRPPLREAVEAGEIIDFANPRCLMRIDGRPDARLELGRYGEAAIRFVEAP